MAQTNSLTPRANSQSLGDKNWNHAKLTATDFSQLLASSNSTSRKIPNFDANYLKVVLLSNLLGLTIRLSWTSFYMSLESLEPGSRTTNSSRSTTTPNSATSVFRQLVGKATRPQGLRGLVRRHRHRQAATSVSVEVEGEEWSPSWN